MSFGIVRVFHIAVGRIGGQILTGFTLLLHDCFDLFTAVLDIEFIHDVQERSKIVVLLIGTVHTAVHSDEANIVFGEKHFYAICVEVRRSNLYTMCVEVKNR